MVMATVLTLGIGASRAIAQGQTGDQTRRGTAGAAHLRVPVTARTAALGAASTAGLDDLHGLEGLHQNPATLMLGRGTGILVSRMDYVVETGINTVGVARRLGSNALALVITAWDFGDIPLQNELSPEITDLTFSPSILTGGLTYARQFTDRIAAGVTIKVVSERIDDMSGTAAAFDGGITYRIDEAGLRFGFSVSNVGTRLEYRGAGLTRLVQLGDQRPDADRETLAIESEAVDLPALMNFGFAWTRRLSETATVSLLGNYRSNSFDQDQVAAGVEVGLLELLYLRGGIDLVSDQDLTLFSGGNFGAGIVTSLGGVRVAVDYAYRPTDYFSSVQLFTLLVTI